MIILSQHDIPEVMVDARFLHRMLGYPDDEHNPHIEGMNPYHDIISARPDVTWPSNKPSLGGTSQLQG